MSTRTVDDLLSDLREVCTCVGENRAQEGDEPSAAPFECNCPERTCQPENNIGRFCWRSGCPIYASDFPTSITSFVEQK
jgi:hypothetical protein